MTRRARNILWIDGGAACVAGLAALVLRDWLAGLYGFSSGLVLFIAVSNLAYASYSGSLALLVSRGGRLSPRAVEALIAANLAWVVICVGILVTMHRFGSAIGLGVVAFEGCFVAALAAAELRYVRPVAG